MENRPYILIIDDEPPALTAMLDALARRFVGALPHTEWLSNSVQRDKPRE